MPEIRWEKLDARLYDLKQDINDTVIAICKRSVDSCYPVDVSNLNNWHVLLKKMASNVIDMQVAIHQFLTVIQQEQDLAEAYRKLLREYTLVKDE